MTAHYGLIISSFSGWYRSLLLVVVVVDDSLPANSVHVFLMLTKPIPLLMTLLILVQELVFVRLYAYVYIYQLRYLHWKRKFAAWWLISSNAKSSSIWQKLLSFWGISLYFNFHLSDINAVWRVKRKNVLPLIGHDSNSEAKHGIALYQTLPLVQRIPSFEFRAYKQSSTPSYRHGPASPRNPSAAAATADLSFVLQQQQQH